MSPLIVSAIAIVGFLLLMAVGMPIGFGMAIAGFFGLVVNTGFNNALYLVGTACYDWTSQEMLVAIPLFVLMGFITFYSGISTDLYQAAHKWLSKRPGGLAQATLVACTIFAACTGDSLGAAATMSAVCYPEMEKLNYSRRLSTATIASGGTLAILIPPSVPFITYAFITQTSVGDMFIAGILPGILLASVLLLTVYVMCKRNPALGPAGVSFSWKERFLSLKGVVPMLCLFALVIGGLYAGIFAPSEAGAVGAFGAFIITLARPSLKNKKAAIISALRETFKVTCFIFVIVIGAMIFNVLLATSGFASFLNDAILGLHVSRYLILFGVLVLYIILGMLMDPLAITLLTIPVLTPIFTNLGFDPIWFGVIFILMTEIGLITPPVGMSVFVVQGVTKAPMSEIFKGVTPFVVGMFVCVLLLILFPQIALWLPHL